MSFFMRSLRRFAIGFLPIVFVICMSSRASATCGDYVHILQKNEKGSGSQSDRLSKENPVKNQSPCHGSRCEQSPIQPVPSPTATQTTIASDAILFDLPIDEKSSSWTGVQDLIVVIQYFPESIFDPPRS